MARKKHRNKHRKIRGKSPGKGAAPAAPAAAAALKPDALKSEALTPQTRRLIFATFAYLALPHLLFALQWLNLSAAAVYVAALAASGFYLARDLLRAPTAANANEFRLPMLLAAVALAAAWTWLSGIGGFAPQNADWVHHNMLLRDLMQNPAPVVLAESNGQPYHLNYYLLYWLPAATIGAWFGWAAANATLLLWSAVGVALALLWLFKLIGLRAAWHAPVAALVFISFGGLDAVGQFALSGEWKPFGSHFEWWHRSLNNPQGVPGVQYSSISTLLFWVPHHAIAGWLIAALVSYWGLHRLPVGLLGPPLAMGFMYSPFIAIGVAPLAALAVWFGVQKTGWRALFSPVNTIAAPVIFAVSIAYLTANAFEVTWGWRGWAGLSSERYLWFMLLDVLVFLPPLVWLVHARGARVDSFDARSKVFFWGAAAAFFLIPQIYMINPLNSNADNFAMRVSIPAMYLLIVFTVRALLAGSFKQPARATLAIIVLLGAITGTSEIWRTVDSYHAQQPQYIAQMQPLPGLHSMPAFTASGRRHTIAERRADPQALFYRYLADK